MKRFIYWGLTLSMIVMGVQDVALAKNSIIVRSAKAKVFEKPSTDSSVLLTLKKGNPIHVLGITKSGWAKVQVNLNGSFGFTGWMFKSSLGVKQTSTPATSPQAPSATSSRERISDLERFFEPTEKSNVLVPRKFASPSKSKSSASSKATKSKNTVATTSSSIEPIDWKTERLSFSIVPTLLLHTYRLSDPNGQIFSYDIMGPALSAYGTLSAPALLNEKLFASVQGGGYFGMMTTNTNLRDGGGNQFGTVKAKNRVLGLNIRGHLLYKVKEAPQGHILVGPTIGYEFLSFNADDITDDNGDRSGLYVSQRNSSMLLGLRGEISLFPPFLITAGADFGINNLFAEDPEDFTGFEAEAGTLIAPYISLMFPIKRPNHFLGMDYRFRYQKIDFTGDSQPRASVTVTDASIEQIYQFIGLHYQHKF
jgi:uncharacterized protein YgiM (DUF1202 family)